MECIGAATRTLSAVAGGSLPGEEAEGPVPRVLEFTVRHPRRLPSLPAGINTDKTIIRSTIRARQFSEFEEELSGLHGFWQ